MISHEQKAGSSFPHLEGGVLREGRDRSSTALSGNARYGRFLNFHPQSRALDSRYSLVNVNPPPVI